MNLYEAKKILKNKGYRLLKERAYTQDEADKIMAALRELKAEYEKKGYTVKLYPTKKITYRYYVGPDPTIGADYYGWATREDYSYNTDIFTKGIKNITADGEVPGKFLLYISKEPSKEYKDYVYKKNSSMSSISFKLYIGFELYNEERTGDNVSWAMGKKYYKGTVDEFISAVKEDIARQELEVKRQNYKEFTNSQKNHNKWDNFDNKRKREKNNFNKRYKRIEQLINADMIGNFDMCREIDEKALNHVMLSHITDRIDDYVYDNFSDEDGRVGWWDYENMWDYTEENFCKYLDEHWGGSFEKFCAENEIDDIELFNQWLDENWQWEEPYEPEPDYPD